MSKFYGEVGFGEQVETSPGVFVEQIIKRNYYGDEEKVISRSRTGENLNDNLIIDNHLSIMADPYANEKFSSIRYIKWMGNLWEVASVTVRRPRLILTLGGIYNEQS